MIEKFLDYFEEKPIWIKILLFIPAILAGILFTVSMVSKQTVAPSPAPITKARKKKKRDLEEERERTEAMIEKMEKESAELEAKQQAVKERAKDAHEAIDAADSFDAVDRIREGR